MREANIWPIDEKVNSFQPGLEKVVVMVVITIVSREALEIKRVRHG